MAADAAELGDQPISTPQIENVSRILPAYWMLTHPMERFMPEDLVDFGLLDPVFANIVRACEHEVALGLRGATKQIEKNEDVFREHVRRMHGVYRTAFERIAEIDDAEALAVRAKLRAVDRSAHYVSTDEESDDPADQKHWPQEDDAEERYDADTAPDTFVPKQAPPLKRAPTLKLQGVVDIRNHPSMG